MKTVDAGYVKAVSGIYRKEKTINLVEEAILSTKRNILLCILFCTRIYYPYKSLAVCGYSRVRRNENRLNAIRQATFSAVYA